MPTNFVKATVFFIDTTSYIPTGWSESHYLPQPDLSLDAAIVRVTSYIPKRQSLLATGINVAYVRVSNDNTFRDSQILPGFAPLLGAAVNANLFPVGGNEGAAQGNQGPAVLPQNPLFPNLESDMGWTSVLIRGEAGAPFTTRAMFWLPGLPDDFTHAANRGITNAQWRTEFDIWANELTQNWGFLAQDNSNANPAKPIVNVTVPVQPGPVSINCPNHGLSSGDLTFVRGVKVIGVSRPPVNALWQVIVTDANNFQLIGSSNLPAFSYLSGGTSRKKTRTFFQYAKILQRRFGMRKKGRPFGLLIGKRPAKKSR